MEILTIIRGMDTQAGGVSPLEEHHCCGALLGKPVLEALLEKGDIFVPGTWVRQKLSAAKYDLRISSGPMIVTNPNVEKIVVPPGKSHTREVTLHPGGIAFVSTVERLRLPHDVVANIGLKFHYVWNGILMLNGLHVDPGYGQAKVDGEPLYFVLANVSTRPITFRPNQDVACNLQFIRVCGATEPEDRKVQTNQPASADGIISQIFNDQGEPILGLAFFQQMAEVREEVQQYQTRIEALEKGTQPLILFGIFLLSVTLLGVALTFLMQAFADDGSRETVLRVIQAVPDSWPVAISLASTAIIVVWLVTGLLGWVIGGIGALPRWLRSLGKNKP